MLSRNLQYGSVKEQSQQLDEVIVHVSVFLFHTDDVGWVVRL